MRNVDGSERPVGAMVESPAIELIGVEKRFTSKATNVQAVEALDFEIGSGEFFSLLGPSGCGKTTTLRMIAGFEQPTRGQIRLYGEEVVGVPPHRRDVNLVFQNYALFPHLNIYDNVAFGLRRRRQSKVEIDKKVRELLELVELGGSERRKPAQLSGGQQQRVALARALVNRPRALLLDEPLGALDLKLRQAMQVELKRIQQEVGITFVYVTHDQGEALTMSDRVVVMNHGRVEQLGSPRELYERPRTRFVAGFIGTSNIISGESTRVVGDCSIIEFSEQERIATPLNGGPPHREVTLAVRPERITIQSNEPAADCQLRGVVELVTYEGMLTRYDVRTSTGDELIVHRPSHDSEHNVERGDCVWLTWRASDSYLLDEVKAANP